MCLLHVNVVPSSTTLSHENVVTSTNQHHCSPLLQFEYWYPMDLRVSAKDLIPNHLTMALYNHAEVWKDQPAMWPRGIYCNGHIMVSLLYVLYCV